MTIQLIPEFTVGDRMRKARELTGLDRKQFSLAAGISRATISSAELGHRNPSNLVLKVWADFTGVPVEWLLTGREPANTPPPGHIPDLRYTPRDSNPEPAGLGHFRSDLHEPYLSLVA